MSNFLGATEALYTDPKLDVTYLRNRKGFIKLAMTHGCKIVPIFSFNECGTYNQLPMSNAYVLWIKKKFQGIFGLSLPLITNIFPNRVHITTVIGDPIDIPHIENPSDEEISKSLDHYIIELEKFYNLHREKYNVPNTKIMKII
jgi:1-acyl-sn-glycerol-3-phosphate acyltransferase